MNSLADVLRLYKMSLPDLEKSSDEVEVVYFTSEGLTDNYLKTEGV